MTDYYIRKNFGAYATAWSCDVPLNSGEDQGRWSFSLTLHLPHSSHSRFLSSFGFLCAVLCCVYIMAPRRPRSTSNVSTPNHNIPRAPTSSPLLRKQIVVASDSIYNNNLTVLKRRDSTIVSIVDQFSHVCLYNYNGRTQKWTKEGFEGSMFLVEQYVFLSLFGRQRPLNLLA